MYVGIHAAFKVAPTTVCGAGLYPSET